MHISIPFSKDMARAVMKGKKVCTTRNKRYGGVGDTFDVVAEFDYATCRLTNLAQMTLENVARAFFKQEGFDSETAFREKWIKLHPVRGFVPEQLVWLHEFEVIRER